MKVVLWSVLLTLSLPGRGHVTSDAKRVVSIPAPFTSHTKYHTNVARALHALGHEVWLTMPDYLLVKGVLDVSNFTLLHYKLTRNYEEQVMRYLRDNYFLGADDAFLSMSATVIEMCDEILRSESLMQQIKDVQPDLIVIDNLPQLLTLTVLPYKLGVPYAMVGTVYDAYSMRIPYSSAVNALQMKTFSDNMTFLERVMSMLMHSAMHVVHPFMRRDVVSLYAPEMPYLSNSMLVARAEVWLVELDHILDYPRPTLPNVKLIGGTATGPAKPLPPQIRAFVDDAVEGVVVVSFGSYVLGVSKDISDKLFRVFRRLPMKIIFRSNLTSPDPAKIMTSKWLPQNDLLGHPNTRLFVSHCGKNGQYEALFHAVPLLCTPMFADQSYNGKRIQQKGFGEVLDLRTVGEDELFTQISAVAREPRYKTAISRSSTLFRQQYGVPMQEAAKWLDHVMEYGGEYMRYAGQKMPLYQFFALDVLAFVFVSGGVVSLLLVSCAKLLYRCCFKRKAKTE